MPAFTLIASYIVAEIGGIALAAAVGSAGLAFVTSAVATTLAIVTARLLGVGGAAGGNTAQDPGVRIQFPPATYNKVPIVYGHAYQKGVVTDARISNGNNTMTYLMVLSEKTQTGTFEVGDMYWNDQPMVFVTSPAGQEHIVAASVENATAPGVFNYNLANLVRIRVYSGGVAAGYQIFPPQSTGNTASATSLLDQGDIKCPAGYALNDLVFAVVQLDYNSSKGVTGLPQLTFELTNSLKNPGLVWYDYMTSDRYGAGISVDQINTQTCISASTTTSLYSISNQIPANQYTPWPYTTSTNYTATSQVRYEINGVISPGDTVKNNLDKIGSSCACWTTYDYNAGQWMVIPNRAATTGELASAFEFNDNNIIGEVGISATNLEDLYNNLEVEFASRRQRDQNDYYISEVSTSTRNTLEPDNTLNMRLNLVNNALHAARIGLIELKGSRVDKIITFRADYSAIQCSAGDVVKITNEVYGFSNSLFRIIKVREVEDEMGGLTVEITASEYNASVYTDETLYDSTAIPGSGIPSFGGSASLAAPSAPTVALITTTTPSFRLSTTLDPNNGPVDQVNWFYNTTSTGDFTSLGFEKNTANNFAAGSTVTSVQTIPASGTFYFKAQVAIGSRTSGYSGVSSPGFVWNPNNYGPIV